MQSIFNFRAKLVFLKHESPVADILTSGFMQTLWLSEMTFREAVFLNTHLTKKVNIDCKKNVSQRQLRVYAVDLTGCVQFFCPNYCLKNSTRLFQEV